MNAALETVQELIPTLGYRELVYSLPFLEDVGVLAEGSLPTMLVTARIMDQGRILQSGMKSGELKDALAAYTRASSGKPSLAVEGALLEAMNTARRAEWERLAGSTR
jgi:hypothetical protein